MSDQRPTILVIDDEELIRISLSAYLEDQDYHVISAESGLGGLEILRDHDIHLVFVDLRMPGLDGFQIVGQIAANRPEIPIIVMSGTSVESDHQEAIDRGAWYYLHKPIHDENLLKSTIKSALEKAQIICK